MSVPPPRAVRDVRVNWLTAVEEVLRPVRGALPLSDTVKNTLAMLQSYEAAPLELFADPATGVSDAKACSALLLALDKIVTAWPHALQQRLSLPEVHMGEPRTSAPLRHYTVTRPRAECVLVCYNGAVANMEIGLDSMDRVRAEASAGGYGATRLSASTGTAAKTAHKTFQRSQELLSLATDVLVAEADTATNATRGAGASPRPLALTDRRDLQAFIDLDTVRPITSLCAAVAKYLFSLSSNTTSERPDLLARVAYGAACLELPAACGPLCVVPTLLLASCHRHMAEYYYSAGRQKSGVPDMARALGHMRYADKLIQDVSNTYAGPPPATHGVQAGLARWKKAFLSTMAAKLSVGGAKSDRSVAQTEDDSASPSALLPVPPSPSPEELDTEDDEERARRESLETSVMSYNRLLKAVAERGDADVMRVFPVLHRLLHQVNLLLRQYEHENRVVYFATVISMDAARDDVPDHPNPSDSREDGDEELARRSAVVCALATQLPASTTFADLPSADQLEAEVARASEASKTADALAAGIDRLDTLMRAVEEKCLQPAAEVAVAVEAVVPCFAQEGTVGAALAMAEEAVKQAWEGLVASEQRWRDKKEAHLGAICARHSSAVEHEAMAKQWYAALTEGQQRWRNVIEGPSGRAIEDEEALWSCLMPGRVDARQAVVEAQALRADACRVMASSMEGHGGAPQSETASATLRQIDRVGRSLETLLKTWTVTHAPGAPATVSLHAKLDAIQDVVNLVWEAPRLVESMTDAASKLDAEAQRVGEVRPLDCIPDGGVRFGTVVKSKKPSSKKSAANTTSTTRSQINTAGTKRVRSHAAREVERDEEELSSDDLHTPTEAPYQEEPTEAKVSSAFLSKLKARRSGLPGDEEPAKNAKSSPRSKSSAAKRAAPSKAKRSKK